MNRLLKLLGDQGYLETISFLVLAVLLFLLPVIISPSSLLTFSFAKTFFVVFLTVLAFVLLVLNILKKGSVKLPKSWLALTIPAVPLIVLVSSLFSLSKKTSLIGYGVEQDTFFFVLIAFVLLFLVSLLFTSAKKIFYAQVLIIIPILILFAFHGLRLIFGPDFLSLGTFSTITRNTFGNWSDLAIFAGLVTIMSTLLLEVAKATKQMRVVAIILFALGLLFLVIVNFFTVWLVLGVFSLIYFVYVFSTKKKKAKFSLSVLIISALFLVFGNQIGSYTDSLFDIRITEDEPSWGQVTEVIKGTYERGTKDIFLGSGPNTFSFNWNLYKPLEVNDGPLWNADLNYGKSYLATSLSTTGILGALAWLLFLAFFIFYGIKSIFSGIEKGSFLNYLNLSTFVSALFLWAMLFLYVPGIVVFTLTFFLTGLSLASFVVIGALEQKEVSFAKSPKFGFIITLILVFVLIAALDLVYISAKKTISEVYYQKGLVHLNQEGDLLAAREDISKATSFAGHDYHYLSLADINLTIFNQIVRNEDVNNGAVVGRADQALTATISNAGKAIEARPLNYINYVALGNIYSNVVPLGVEGAGDGARGAYIEATKYAPTNPAILLELARLEAKLSNIEKVREYIGRARELKSNYTEALFTLAQIEVAAGNVEQAIASLEVSTLDQPNNPTLYFQLGFLYYNNEDYRQAASSFENAIELIPDYANAKYFLGLSYYELDRVEDAIKQFADIKETNQDNQEVQFILGNLRSGRAPFEEVQPPLDDEPEDREELPVEEE